MRAKLSKLLVTGGAGFIASEFVRQAVQKGYKPAVVDRLTYAADLERLKDVKGKISFYPQDICSKKQIERIFKTENPRIIVHFAAESHVDRSIHNSGVFIKTNVLGTQVLLDLSRSAGIEKFIHISTDEVYGDIRSGVSKESDLLCPSSPYSASKAAADLLVGAYVRTYNFPAVILRPSNNYGPWQYPEKFIPLIIVKALTNEKIPVYEKGLNIREWLYVADCADAVLTIVKNDNARGIYNIGSGCYRHNIEVVKLILDILDKPQSLIEFVKDRPGHDFRYALDSSRIKQEFSWLPEFKFEQAIEKTITWCKENSSWLFSKVKYLRRHWRRTYVGK